MPKILSTALERKVLGRRGLYSRPNRAKMYQSPRFGQAAAAMMVCHAGVWLVGLSQVHYVSASMLYGIEPR
jgi:hypothetical protein